MTPFDYEHTEGEITFLPGKMVTKIPIVVKARGRYEGTEMFQP